ncbi:SDR family oxidoreductase [Yinghuangia seranimata]|uniref:SDR family oxidoreductase n=1 Tax=Yinghuangia seranimata TaxID=408067 RepID=UPI00248CD5E8|nr:NAD(P)H-binding protein [Yinghuangia seranimata]MDI2128269.1 NAD(P)H-binding protein [Yinghuangia seranimata]
MPVVVTGAGTPLGRALALALVERGVPDVRAVVRDPAAAAALRVAGVRVSVGDLSDPLRLGAVLEDAHTVVHLDAGPDGRGGPLDTWEWLLDAAEDTGLRRVVTALPDDVPAPAAGGYELVVVRTGTTGPGPEHDVDQRVLAALLEADRRA